MSLPKLLAAAALGTLCLLAAFPHVQAAAGAESQLRSQPGMTVVRDPVTGKLRAPTPEELKVLRAKTPPRAGLQAAQPAEPKVLERRPDGARGVRLGEKTLVYEVVTRGADGKLSSQCVHGDDAAAHAVANPDAASAHAAGADHEEQAHEIR